MIRRDEERMHTSHYEIRMMWLMSLTIIAIAAWFLAVPLLSALCGIALLISLMQYVDGIEASGAKLALQAGKQIQHTSKIPLYLATFVVLLGMVGQWGGLIGLGISGWLFFFFRWLRRLEVLLFAIQSQQITPEHTDSMESLSTVPVPMSSRHESSNLFTAFKHWLWQGNPVLKVAIAVLLVGLILLLRFATEHWQLSLALKLGLISLVNLAVVVLGYLLTAKNPSFALALEALGLSGLFLTLFFAYYNLIIATLLLASICFLLIITLTVVLSSKQKSIELALIAMTMAYLAPFTLPVSHTSAIALLTYYVLINLAVAILSSIHPWKVLNHIAFLVTIVVGGGYTFYQGEVSERTFLSGLILIHGLIFIWLSFRYSQLLARDDIIQFKLKPLLDLVLIFAAPLVAFAFLYLLYFEESLPQASFSLGFAVLYFVLYQMLKSAPEMKWIAQSYFSLGLIFLALILPIMLVDQWSVIGWSVESGLVFIYALYRKSKLSRYLGMGLSVIAALSGGYYVLELQRFPSEIFWVLCASYLIMVAVANSCEQFRQQLTFATILFLGLQLFLATSLLFILLLDQLESQSQVSIALFILVVLYVVLNEGLLYCKARWPWLLPKWLGLIPLYVVACLILIDFSQHDMIIWPLALERWLFALSGLLLTYVWIRPLYSIAEETEWVSLAVLISLALTSLTLLPAQPYLSITLLPLAFAAACYVQPRQRQWRTFWQARSSLFLVFMWIICAQLFNPHSFEQYWLPLINPFDLVSLAILIVFIWMLNLQMKAGLEKSLAAILMMSSLLWLSSYVVLRALHVYFETPYNDLQMWQNALVQLSLTLLWVSLAWGCMWWATRRNLRSLWIFGGGILILVSLKLVLFDLSQIGTLMRVLSFLGAGLMMLIIAYIAPMPQSADDQA